MTHIISADDDGQQKSLKQQQQQESMLVEVSVAVVRIWPKLSIHLNQAAALLLLEEAGHYS